ncbi:MAG: glycosyltransferase family 4 protein [Patescibacteria group bacterium]
MAQAFAELLGKDFLFFVRGNIPDELKDVNAISVKLPKRFRIALYFIFLPIFIVLHKWNAKDIVFFSYDPFLLSILIFWRKIFRFQYSICSDWHQLFDDWKDKYVAKNSDYLISTSKRLKELLHSVCGIDQNKILVAYGGVNVNLYIEKSKIKKEEYRQKLELPIDSFLVGYVGSFRSVGMEKGLDIMIKSFSYLDEKIMMVFVGGSKQHINEYMMLAREKNVLNRCIFVEKQKPFDKVVEYMLAMDILVIPYPDKRHFRDYGFPMKVWEYMASGRPIVYSNLEIIGEILKGRATAFKPDDASSLAEAILSLYQDRESAERLAKQNPEDVLAYTWKARVKNILDFVNL